MNPVDQILAHHGIRGMKWGVRRDRSTGSSHSVLDAHPAWAKGRHDAKAHSAAKAKIAEVKAMKERKRKMLEPSHDAKTFHDLKKKPLHTLTNEELKHLTARFELERKYASIPVKQKKRGRKYVAKLMKASGDQQAKRVAGFAAAAAVNLALAKAGAKPGAHAVVTSMALMANPKSKEKD